MTSPPSPPNRRRRRVVVAVAVLVAAAMVTWWYWPRGDARFVGKWDVETTDAPPTIRSLTWDLHSNGVGTAAFVSGANLRQTFSFRWIAEGDRLRCGYSTPRWIHKALNTIQQKLLRLTGSSFVHAAEAYH